VQLADLFPPCLKESCDRPDPIPTEDGRHRHLLPTQRRLFESNAKYIALVGGYGSGKTLPACIKGHLLSISIPGNMGIVLRRSIPKLHDATERIYLEVVTRWADLTGTHVEYRESRDGWPHRLVYPNGSEVVFRETKDLGRFLGPEYGWFLLDEAQEEPEKTFKDLMGRLRLPRASEYLTGILCTNPPHKLHWIAKRFPREGAWTTTELVEGKDVHTRWEMIQSSTLGNPFLDPEYVAGLLGSHTADEIKRIVHGYYGVAYDGRPVLSQFDYTKHVASIPTRLMTLYRVWDFGYHHPATTWHQMFWCEKKKLHWVVLHEYGGRDIYAEQYAALVLAVTKQVFPEIPPQLVVDGGDFAGTQGTDAGPGPIIRLSRPPSDGGFGLKFHYRKLHDVDPGLDLIRKCLRERCRCGYPLLMVHRRCETVCEAMAGGYHYPPEKVGAAGLPAQRKPVKDGHYDNFIDTVRYAGELFYRSRSRGEDFLDELIGERTGPAQWAWMER
jgi:hypothetical protein